MKILRKTILFKNVTKDWLLFKKSSVKESTYFRYKYIINKYLLPHFATKTIYYFETYDFNLYINNLTKIIASKTVKDIICVFKSILQYIEMRFNVNYALKLISTPKNEVTDLKVLKENEIKKLELYCFGSNDLKNIGIAICLNTGLRLGEICALTWENIDLDENLIIVNKTIQRVYKGKKNTSIQINSPKTRNSMRKIPIPKKLCNVLKLLNKINRYSGEEYFLTGSKKFIEPRNYEETFKKCLKICNIPNYKFHILRHTFATNCINIGMDVKSLSEILGHANVNITLNRYVHSSYEAKRKFLDKL